MGCNTCAIFEQMVHHNILMKLYKMFRNYYYLVMQL
jgi:hypothetical protein